MTKSIPVKDITDYMFYKKEGRKFYPSVINNYGALFLASAVSNNPPVQGGNNLLNWRNATTTTVVANQFYLMNTFLPSTGRALVIFEIEIEVTKACTITISQEVTDAPRDGSTAIQLANMFQTFQKTTTGAGTVKFQFSQPLIIKTGERLNVLYSVSDTTSTNWQINVTNGYDITDDFDYTSSENILIIGDSLMITSEYKAVLYEETSDSSVFYGLTSHILKNKLKKQLNKDYRIVTICQQGSNTSQWDDMVRRGRIDDMYAKYMLSVLGMNDCTSNTGLSITAGTDGYFKTSLKNIIKKWSIMTHNNYAIITNIPATDDSIRTAIISVSAGQAGYRWNGIARRTAYNNEIAEVVTEMTALGYNVKLADISTAYTTSEAAFSDSSPKVHANSTLGHPRIASIIYNTIISI